MIEIDTFFWLLGAFVTEGCWAAWIIGRDRNLDEFAPSAAISFFAWPAVIMGLSIYLVLDAADINIATFDTF